MFKREQNIIEQHLQVLNPIREMLDKAGAVIAGGAVASIFTSRKVNDLDIYLRDPMDINRNPKDWKLQDHLPDCKQVYQTNNAITYKSGSTTIQLIPKYSAGVCLDKFDFTIVQGLYDLATQKFELRERFIVDNSQRRLSYTGGSDYPICALFRTKKYQARGYTLSGSEMVKIAFAINRLNLNHMPTLRDQIIGIDTMYLNMILKALEDKHGNLDKANITLDEFSRLWDNMVLERTLAMIDDALEML